MTNQEKGREIAIRLATDSDRNRWDAFVDRVSADFYYYFDWGNLYSDSGQDFIPLLAEGAEGKILGLFPLVRSRHLLYSTLATLPIGSYGRPACDPELDAGTRHMICSKLLTHALLNYTDRCANFVVRDCISSVIDDDALEKILKTNGFRLIPRRRGENLPCTYKLDLPGSFEEIWQETWSKGIRKEIRRAERDGFQVIVDHDLDYLDSAVIMFEATYRHHSTAPPSAALLRKRVQLFGDKAKLHIGLLAGEPRFAMLCYYTPTTCYISKTGYLGEHVSKFKRLCYRTVIEDACRRGLRHCEFGVTNTGGQAAFKERFAGACYPIEIYEKICSLPRAVALKTPLAWNLVASRLLSSGQCAGNP